MDFMHMQGEILVVERMKAFMTLDLFQRKLVVCWKRFVKSSSKSSRIHAKRMTCIKGNHKPSFLLNSWTIPYNEINQ